MHKYLYICIFSSLLGAGTVQAQTSFRFAQISDTHVGSATGAEDLRRVVHDINADSSLAFVILSGDITEFGADTELRLARRILDSLQKPLYVIPGNHDANWSESGANSVMTVFGAQHFAFRFGGYLFAGTASGPFMRMGPGQIPREDIVWLDSLLSHMADTSMPVIFVNHYPLDSSLNNWYEALDLLKHRNLQLVLCGHGHSNHRLLFEGVPGVMTRSVLRGRADVGGYSIVTMTKDSAVFRERHPGQGTAEPWTSVPLVNHRFGTGSATYPRPSYAVNREYPAVRTLWQYRDSSDIGSGTAVKGNLVFSTNTRGELYALDMRRGRVRWRFPTGGKIFSTPAVSGKQVVVASSDQYIYSVEARTGHLQWKTKTGKPCVASPLIRDGMVYIGASDGHFRALDLKTGQVQWDFPDVTGFVVSKPLYYGGKIYFGCWNNDFYALDAATGRLVWRWNNHSGNRMYSPAVCQPAATAGRIFLVAPDRYMTVLQAATGEVIWRKRMPGVRVRESMGMSADSSLVYVKTMEGEVYGVSTSADSMTLSFHPSLQLGYEICPTPILEQQGVVYIPTQSGTVCALDRISGLVQWKHKVSNGLVNQIWPLRKGRVLVSTMDGRITCLHAP